MDQPGLRNRHKNKTIYERITELDIYPKTKEHIQNKSEKGGIISLIFMMILLILALNEIYIYFSPDRKDTLGIDKKPEGIIDIMFNITFPHIKCADLHVDVIDASGTQQIDIYNRMHRQPVDEEMRLVGKAEHVDFKEVYDPLKDPKSPFYCGSCYLAQESGQCCNTCQDILVQYQRKGIARPNSLGDFEQCLDHFSMDFPGCNMYGALRVNKVSGNFHFAPGRSFSHEHDSNVHHIHEFNPYLISRYNTSHYIHELSFGVKIPYVKYPLENTYEIVPNYAIHKYFIKIVPTTVKTMMYDVETYQYSFNTYIQQIDLSKQLALPGIFFIYDLSPIVVTYQWVGMSFTHLMMKLFALFGGVLSLLKFIHYYLK